MDLQLQPEQIRRLREAAQQAGKTKEQVACELIDEGLARRTANGTPALDGESFHDAATRLGLAGCCKGGPSDMSTNAKYLEGLGT